MNTFGQYFRLTTFGESHGVALGAVIDGCPAGLELSEEDIQQELNRRRPGQSAITTPRNEADRVEVLSGIFEGKTTGTPIAAIVRNADHRSADYESAKRLFRPGHADEVWANKFGHRDHRGGGRASGRETLSRVIGGAVAAKLLSTFGTRIVAGVTRVGSVRATSWNDDHIEQNPVRCPDLAAAEQMAAEIQAARQAHDSLGAEVEIRIKRPPKMLGSPVFGKAEALLGAALLSIGTVRAFQFGTGTRAAELPASQQNPIPEGISGGITTGTDITLLVHLKAPPTIARPQQMRSVGSGNTTEEATIAGRHDPCIAPRFVPVAEAMVALTLADLALAPPSRLSQCLCSSCT